MFSAASTPQCQWPYTKALQIVLMLGPADTLCRWRSSGGNFYDSLKSITSGYASFDYEAGEQRKADLVRLDLLLNGEPIDALARIVHRC